MLSVRGAQRCQQPLFFVFRPITTGPNGNNGSRNRYLLQAPPVVFVAGVLGPLIGADLLHLRDIEKITTGIASIGGAGTFDGIVLSGIVAAYLA